MRSINNLTTILVLKAMSILHNLRIFPPGHACVQTSIHSERAGNLRSTKWTMKAISALKNAFEWFREYREIRP